MRQDVYIQEVLSKCVALKQSGIWPAEPVMRPLRWLNNFDEADRYVAAVLLDKFNFYNERLTNCLLISSFNSLSDNLSKGPTAPSAITLVSAMENAVFTLVEGEHPNVTDSGYNFCRRARQVLRVPENLLKTPIEALLHARQGGTVIFVDDLVGSGDQFLKTWRKNFPQLNASYQSVQTDNPFNAIYVTLVATSIGLRQINLIAPTVAVSVTHVLDERSTFRGIAAPGTELMGKIYSFLLKYSLRLTPIEDYIANNISYKAFGYKNLGLMFGFSHSIPDATLPIFWSPGDNNWEPLIERV